MLKIYILFAFSAFLEKANRYLLPCPFKYLTGLDCPGCGFQRSVLALLKGNYQESFHLYPAAIPLIITFIVSLTVKYWWKAKSKILINSLCIFTGSIVMVSYVFKILVPHIH